MEIGAYRKLLVIGALGIASGAACSAGTSPEGDGPSATGAGAGTEAGPGSGGSGAGFSTGGNGTGGVDDPCPNTCSEDLHDVLDCNGNVVATCPPDQGCSSQGCVPACQSAADNKSTVGCDYLMVPPDTIDEGHGACYAAFITNTWGIPVTMTLDRGGVAYDAAAYARIPSGSGQLLTYAELPNGEIPPGEVAIVFLSRYGDVANDCPPGIVPALTQQDPAVHGTGIGSAFRITTSAPVVAYDIYPYGGGVSALASATLLLPTSAWGDNYLAISAFRKSAAVPQASPFVTVVAAEDSTQVTINPTAAIVPGIGVPGTNAGVPKTYLLQKGQYLQFTQPAELSGSPIQSDKPVGVFGGATCLNIDIGMVACDAAHQQIPPISALGHEYVAVRYRNRFDDIEESPPWRIMGTVDGTTLTYDPAPPPGAPTSISSGQVVEFRSEGQFVVRSQDADHPFYVSAHMAGCQEVNPTFSDCRGDPEFVNVVPVAQFLDEYVFFTDPTYPETNLLLVRRKKDGAFHDVELDCYGVVDGWQPLGASGNIEFSRIDLVRGNFEKQGECDNGRHEIKSAAPFGLTVWGWGSVATGGDWTGTLPGIYSQAVSYAYPSGASVKPINTVKVPAEPR
jgi:hypothetical protein